MFTWICPKCGKEVPPHESECPYCHGTGKVEEAPAAEQSTPPPPPQPPAAPPAQPQQAAPVYPPPPPPAQPGTVPPQAAPPQGAQQYYELGGNQRRGLPGWAVMIVVALVILGIGYVLYTYVLPSNQSASRTQGESPFEEVEAAKPSAETARIARHIEATGFRISEDSQQRAEVQYLIINHSAADIGNLAGVVNIRVHDASRDDPPIFRIEFETDKLGPYESKEFKTMIKTELRAYEIPDWQFLRGDVEITSPTSSD